MPVRLVSVSPAEVGTLRILHTRVVPAGFVPVLVKLAKLTVVVGQVLVSELAAKTGATVPAGQLHTVSVTVTESAGLKQFPALL